MPEVTSPHGYRQARQSERYLKADLHPAYFDNNTFFVPQPRYLRAANESRTGACRSVGAGDVAGIVQVACSADQVHGGHAERANPDPTQAQPM
jgi:hypothetical protein